MNITTGDWPVRESGLCGPLFLVWVWGLCGGAYGMLEVGEVRGSCADCADCAGCAGCADCADCADWDCTDCRGVEALFEAFRVVV